MSTPYSLHQLPEETSFYFITDTEEKYTVYFSAYYLQSRDGDEILITSFGFDSETEISAFTKKHDPRIKATIIQAIEDFFSKNGDDALLYICMTGDGFARNRKITFARWANEASSDIVRFPCKTEHEIDGFHSSLLLKRSNPNKGKILDAFYFSHEVYFGES